MANFEDIYNDVLKLDETQRLSLAYNCVSNLRNALGDQMEFFKLVRLISQVFVSADRKCDKKEYDLYINTTGDKVSFEQFYKMTDGGASPDKVNALIEFTSRIDKEFRLSIALFGCCLMAHDGELSPEEKKLFSNIVDVNKRPL